MLVSLCSRVLCLTALVLCLLSGNCKASILWQEDEIAEFEPLASSIAPASLSYLKLNNLYSVNGAQAVALDSLNNAYVGATSGLYKYGNSSSSQPSLLYQSNVTGVAIHPKGHAFFVDYILRNVMVYNITTRKVSVFTKFLTTDYGVPYTIALDSVNNIYVSMDCECTSSICTCPLMKINPTTKVASVFLPKYSFQNSFGLVVSSNNILYISDSGHYQVFKIDLTASSITPVVYAGNGLPGHTGDGGLATSASIYYPRGLAIDANGNLFIAEGLGNTIRRIDTAGKISTYAGVFNASRPRGGYTGNGLKPNVSMLSSPRGIAFTSDSSSSLIIADFGNNLVRGIYSIPPAPTLAPTSSPVNPPKPAADISYGNLIPLWAFLGLLVGIAVAVYIEKTYYLEDFRKFWGLKPAPVEDGDSAPVPNPLHEDL